MPRKDDTKIEKKAKILLLNKDIPQDKMDIVRSLIYNNSLTREEKYSAVIDIIKFCPDKKIQNPKPIKTETTETIQKFFAPAESSQFVNQLYLKYKPTKLFKKRYLIHVNNRLGIGIQKRLIPSKRLLKVIRDIVSYQEKILSRLPDILMSVLKDETIEDATHFNYLRIFRRWMMETPIIKYYLYEIKWMSPGHIETELQSYITSFYSFYKLDIETKEQIILLVENKLRLLNDLKKEEVFNNDSSGQKNEKDKRNLKREKIVYEYMMALRSFLQPHYSGFNRTDILSDHLKIQYGINSLAEFLFIIAEALIFQRPIELKDLLQRYDIRPYLVNSENWDYSPDFLKEIGKDPESKRKRRLQRLKNELIPFDELYSFLKLRSEGQLVLQNAMETQWKIADKRQKDYTTLYNEDFLSFIDVCINFFNNSYVPVLNGSSITFQDKNKVFIEGSLFATSFFASELLSISNLTDELYQFKSKNPRLTVTHEEAMKILQGKIHSMFEVERFIVLTGDLFNQIGDKLQNIFDIHRLWAKETPSEEMKPVNVPIKKIPNDKGPIPFYNCIIIDFKDKRLLTDRQINNIILSDSAKSGIIITITAFAYQLAFECLNENIFSKLEKRKEILKKIDSIGG